LARRVAKPDAAVGVIEKRLMTWQPKAGETEKL